MQNSNEVTQRFHKITFHQPQNINSLKDTGNNTKHMVFEGELAVKLHAIDVEVGSSSDRNPIKEETMGSDRNHGISLSWIY